VAEDAHPRQVQAALENARQLPGIQFFGLVNTKWMSPTQAWPTMRAAAAYSSSETPLGSSSGRLSTLSPSGKVVTTAP